MQDIEQRIKNFSESYGKGKSNLELPGFFGKKMNWFIETNGLYERGIKDVSPFAKVLLEKDLLLPIFESNEKLGRLKTSIYTEIMDSISPGHQFFCDGPKQDIGVAVVTQIKIDLTGPEPEKTYHLSSTPQTYYPYVNYKGKNTIFSILIPYPDTGMEILFPYFVCMTGEMPTKESVLKRRDEFEMHEQTSKLVDELSDMVEYDIVKDQISEILSKTGF